MAGPPGTIGVRRAKDPVTQTGRASSLAPDTRKLNAGAGMGASSLAVGASDDAVAGAGLAADMRATAGRST